VQTNWVCSSGTQRFCKNDSDSSLESLTVTRVESFCGKYDSCRVTILFNVTQVESESPKIVTRVELLTRVTLSLLIFKKWLVLNNFYELGTTYLLVLLDIMCRTCSFICMCLFCRTISIRNQQNKF